MRKIVMNISSFGLESETIINITLFNKIGDELTTTYNNKIVSFNKNFTITANNTEIELYENDKLPISSYYELKIQGIKFRFQLNTSNDNLTHELISLLELGSNDGIAYFINDEIVFEKYFIEKINLKLSKQEPYFTENQERVFNFYIYYADYVLDKGMTIDLEKRLNKHLGSYNG